MCVIYYKRALWIWRGKNIYIKKKGKSSGWITVFSFLTSRMHIPQRILHKGPEGIILRTCVLAFLCFSSHLPLFRGLVSLGGSIRKYNNTISSIFQDMVVALWHKGWIIFKYMSTSWPCVLNLDRSYIVKDLILLIHPSEWHYLSSEMLFKLQKECHALQILES